MHDQQLLCRMAVWIQMVLSDSENVGDAEQTIESTVLSISFQLRRQLLTY